MKTEAELRELHDLMDWYFKSPRITRQDHDTKNNLLGVEAVTRWVFGTDENASELIDRTIADIKEMQRLDGVKKE